MRIWPGKPYPLGATWDGMGVNFALFSENASKIELCLFDSVDSNTESLRVVMPEYTDHVWHCYLPDTAPGQLYGYRVYGPYEPQRGFRFNSSKVVLDPYAKIVHRADLNDSRLFAYKTNHPNSDLEKDGRDNAACCPLGVVVDSAFTWGDDRPPRTPWHKTIIYEAHIKGMTARHPEVGPKLLGTYAGFSCEPVIRHLLDLGVTAVELMPVHQRYDELHLRAKGLTNYWGYNTIGFFAPDLRFSSDKSLTGAVREFKMMVRELHAAGIEVILDVVYNHTAEGNQCGPTLSFRGIDNLAYYRLPRNQPRYYTDFTGCGNTLNMQHPRVLQLVMDSLRYWVEEMHVDGFRFDLASALARELHDVNKLAAFFDIIHQDPVISQVKLIAEPWDLGDGGYQVGNFPVLWTEWNGKYRDCIRSFWKGDNDQLGEMATRISGSSDLYQWGGRSPYASINFITCHDGFSLADLVGYNEKHNEANLENNQDGNSNNISGNCGAEGPTNDPNIIALRLRQRRNFLLTLILSAGVPMIRSGDELGQSQNGNNNPYCQDNELSWLNWELDSEGERFLDFARALMRIRQTQAVFQRRKFYTGAIDPGSGVRDLTWYARNGKPMSYEDWHDHELKVIGACFSGAAVRELDERGVQRVGDTLLIVLNAGQESSFVLPEFAGYRAWELLCDTASGEVWGAGAPFRCLYQAGEAYHLVSSSAAVFKLDVPLAVWVRDEAILRPQYVVYREGD